MRTSDPRSSTHTSLSQGSRFDTLRSGELRIFLSEHGDAPRGAIVYLHVTMWTLWRRRSAWRRRTRRGGCARFAYHPAGNELRIGSGI